MHESMNRIFEHPLTVAASEIDSLKHVNNEVYLKWLVEAAVAHSESLGYTIDTFIAGGAAFVVRRHEIDYLLPAYLGEALVVQTWLETMETVRSVRHYQIVRKNDGKTLVQGKTLWVYIDLKTGRPKPIPEDMIRRYSEFLKTPSA